ncbi:MAG: hypothetical protein MIO92_03860 [Methanosarcinaceae archaeon]|nr:hypothetical protein [Methanosarcinaceae archaeon]
MARSKICLLAIFLIGMLLFPGARQLGSTDRLTFAVALGSFTATEKPFDPFPFLKIGFRHDFPGSLAVGVSLAFTKWSDYLNMYGGAYTFNCYRPAIELTYLFPSALSSVIIPLAGVGLGYNFYRVKNELGNTYPGGLKDRFFLAPYAGADFSLGEKARGAGKIVSLTARLVWNVSGDFSGLHGSLGLGIRIK